MKPTLETAPKRLILVDGYGFVFRAYHSMPPLTNPSGTPVGAVFGFTNMLSKLVENHEADYIAVILDAGSKTFRNEIYSEYKANRPPAPEDLIPQFPLVRKAVEALNLPAVEMKGFEADDLIATYTHMAVREGLSVRIVSSDKDLMQLVGQGVELYDPMKAKIVGAEGVFEKFGVTPDKVLDALSLIGDSSDNVPGVPGIGPKIAAELIEKFGSLDAVLANADTIKQKKRKENLINFADQARLSRDLIRLKSDVDITVPLEDFKVREPNYRLLYDFAKTHNFKSLVAKMATHLPKEELVELAENQLEKAQQSVSFEKITVKMIEKAQDLTHFLKAFEEIETLAIYVPKDKKGAMDHACIAVNNDNVALIRLGQNEAQQSSLFGDAESVESGAVDLPALAQIMLPYMADPAILVIGCDVKSLARNLGADDFPLVSYDDVALMSYVLQAGLHGHSLAEMSLAYLNESMDDITLSLEKEHGQQAALVAEIAVLTPLYHTLRYTLFESRQLTLYERMEKPLSAVLFAMEKAGICLDKAYMAQLSQYFAKDTQQQQAEIYQLAGEEFNIGSPKQMGEILFERMGLQGGKKSKKSGAYSTDSDVLETLSAEGHIIATHILRWRQLSKLKSTYSDALPKQIEADGRIHTHYAMTATNTGRLSSHNPNLQNIPIRTQEGVKLRQGFVCREGYQLLSADYSQIELRLLAHMADIEVLKQAFKEGKDIHAITASQVFGVPLEQVTGDIRRKAKAINFGIIYGMSAFGLAKRLAIGRGEAARYIDIYFEQYPGIQHYMEQTKALAKEHGYVETLWGRRCHIKGINDKNGAVRQFSERAAINAPLQGSAADIIKKAMVSLQRELLEQPHLQSTMLLQVHDELILEAPKQHAKACADLVKKTMENVAKLSIPLDVEVGVGNHWGEIH